MLQFPPEVFARLEPDLYFQRHIQQGVRPAGLRALDEFRPVSLEIGSTVLPQCIGSSVLRVGETTILCGLTAGTSQTPGALYTNVEIMRGSRSGPPTLEEMTVSQRLFQLANGTDLVDKQNYIVVDELEAMTEPTGMAATNDLDNMDVDTEGDLDEDRDRNVAQREIVGVKYLSIIAHIQVLSRSGPVIDTAWNALVAALHSAKLPIVYIDPTSREVCIDDSDSSKLSPLRLGSAAQSYSSTFGVYEDQYYEEADQEKGYVSTPKQHLLSDIETTAEEKILQARISVCCASNGKLNGLSIRTSGSTKLSKETIRLAIARARTQAQVLQQKITTAL